MWRLKRWRGVKAWRIVGVGALARIYNPDGFWCAATLDCETARITVLMAQIAAESLSMLTCQARGGLGEWARRW